jgi:hypothetical protein
MPAAMILIGALVLLMTVAAFSSIRIASAARPSRLQLRSGLRADCPDHIACSARVVKPE